MSFIGCIVYCLVTIRQKEGKALEIARLILEYIEVLIWPGTVIVLLLLFRTQIGNMLYRVKKANLPGGISIETFPERLEEAKKLSVEVRQEKPPSIKGKEHPRIPLTEANARMLNLGLRPSTSGLEFSDYRIISEKDPNLALAGLRIEIETMLKNLAKGFKVTIGERDGAGIIVKRLKEKNAIISHQAELLDVVIRLCNAAIHGVKVTFSQAEEILDIAEMLRDQYVSWLSWGFPDK